MTFLFYLIEYTLYLACIACLEDQKPLPSLYFPKNTVNATRQNFIAKYSLFQLFYSMNLEVHLASISSKSVLDDEGVEDAWMDPLSEPQCRDPETDNGICREYRREM